MRDAQMGRERTVTQRLVSREEQQLWVYQFRQWLLESQSMRDALRDDRLRLPADLRDLVAAAALHADMYIEAVRG